MGITRSLAVLAYIALRAERDIGDGITTAYGRVVLPVRTRRLMDLVELPPGRG